ncbi:MAG: type III pantothenate kinase, partial [Spirochaetaceae bacterium]|nr:type III pantothenate kinase [Spirochaetaceae bacterium]
MLLAIDIGNSTIGAVLFPKDGDSFLPLENIPTDAQLPRGEYARIFRESLQSSGAGPGEITAAIASSVVPALTDTFLGMVEEITGVKPLLVSHALYHLLPITMPE